MAVNRGQDVRGRFLVFEVIVEVIVEPMGGAHRDIEVMSETLKARLTQQLDELSAVPFDTLLERRFERLMSYGNPA